MKNNLKDKKVLITFLIAVMLIFLHTWQYINSHDPRALVNLIMCSIYIPVALLFGFRALPYFLLSYCFIYLPLEEFDNYTSLFLLCSATSLNKKLRFCFIPYVIETITVYIINDFEISHICITFLYILFFWQIYVIIVENKFKDFEPLDLKPEEEKILIELCKGKQQKEIDFYSPQTVSKKLREAAERNNCLSPEELKLRYKLTNQFN